MAAAQHLRLSVAAAHRCCFCLRLRRHLASGSSISSQLAAAPPSDSGAAADSAVQLLAGKAHSLWEKLSHLKPDSPPDARLLKVAVLGPTGVGKSSLVNMLACYRSCAVSQRINTTRSKQAVVTTRGNTQLVFVDLPGLLSEEKRRRFNLENYIMRDVHSNVFQADLLLILVDASHKRWSNRLDPELLKALHYFSDKPSVLVLNKVDLLRGSRVKLLDLVRSLTDGVVAGRVSHIDKYASRLEAIDTAARHLLSLEGRRDPAADALDASVWHGLWDRRWERHLVPPIEVLQRHLVPPPDVLMWGPNPPAPTPMLTPACRRALLLLPEPEVSPEKAELAEDELLLSAEPDRQPGTVVDQDSADPLPACLAEEAPKPPTMSKLDPFTLWLREQMLLGCVSKAEALARRKRWREIGRRVVGQGTWRGFQEAFMVSAATGEGVDSLRDYLFSIAQPSPWLFHSSCLSDMEPADLVRMCVWSKCLDLLPKEVPYKLRFELVSLDRLADGRVDVSVLVHCSSLRALACLIGRDGGNIRDIALAAKEELQDVFRANVSLKLEAVRGTVPAGHLSFIKKAKSLSQLLPEVAQ